MAGVEGAAGFTPFTNLYSHLNLQIRRGRYRSERAKVKHGEDEKRSDAVGAAVDARRAACGTGSHRRKGCPLGMLTGLLEMDRYPRMK